MTNNQQDFQNFRTLRQVAMRVHNPQVLDAYRSQDKQQQGEATGFLRKNLIILPDDNINTIQLKLNLFYLSCGRLPVAIAMPHQFSFKAETYRPQLAIGFRPAERRRLSYGKYDRNIYLNIPHYDGTARPDIKGYRCGNWSAKYGLIDGSYLLVNALEKDEAIAMVRSLAAYTKKSKRPKVEHITVTERAGNDHKLKGRAVVPFQARYYAKGEDGAIYPDWTIQL